MATAASDRAAPSRADSGKEGMRSMRDFAPVIMLLGFLVGGQTSPAAARPTEADLVAGETWVARFNGAANMDDTANAVAVSPDGTRVFVTGRSAVDQTSDEYLTIAYGTGGGEQLWVAEYPAGSVARDIAVSPDGQTVLVTGVSYHSTYPRAVTVAYHSSDGTQSWVATGPNDSSAYALSVTPDGSTVAVTGNLDFYGKMATTGYSVGDGSRRWVAVLTDGGYESTTGRDVTVSPDGHTFYATGYAYNGNSEEYLTEAIDAVGGQRVWRSRYNSPGSGYDEAFGIVISPDGARVFVTGCSGGVYCNGSDYGTIAYDVTTGSELWVRVFDSGGTDVARSIAISPDGTRVVVTGSSGIGPGQDYTTIAYDPDGTQRWLATYDGPAHSADFANIAAVSPDGCCAYVTGASMGPATKYDYGTVAYSLPSGGELWVDRYDGPTQGNDVANGLGVSSSGVLFVTGKSRGPRVGNDYATVAIAP
jgi:WD40 repeat protein